MAIDTKSLTQLISEFRLLTEKDSITPEALGAILQRATDLIGESASDTFQTKVETLLGSLAAAGNALTGISTGTNSADTVNISIAKASFADGTVSEDTLALIPAASPDTAGAMTAKNVSDLNALLTAVNDTILPLISKLAKPNGIAPLDSGALIPQKNLPATALSDIIEFGGFVANVSATAVKSDATTTSDTSIADTTIANSTVENATVVSSITADKLPKIGATLLYDTVNKRLVWREIVKFATNSATLEMTPVYSYSYWAPDETEDTSDTAQFYRSAMLPGGTPRAGKLYVNTSTGTMYRWNGTDLVVVQQSFDYAFAYGVEIDTTTGTVNRVGNPQLHRELPVQSAMRGCLLSDGGSVIEYLPEDDWTSATRDGSRGQVMVEIPAHYRCITLLNGILSVLISMLPLPGYVRIERAYVSAYEATLQRSTEKLASVVNATTDYRGGNNNASWDGTYRSFLGKPACQFSRIAGRNYARARKANSCEWNILTYHVYKTLYWLFVTEYASLNIQDEFNDELTADGYRQGGLGDGATTLNGSKWNAFNGYRPFIPCGHTDSLGNRSGIVPFSMPEEYDTTSLVVNVPRYRGIENFFGHLWKLVDGILVLVSPTEANGGTNLTHVFTATNPAIFSDETIDRHTFISAMARTSGYIKSIATTGDIIPTATGASATTFFRDYFSITLPNEESLFSIMYGGSANTGTQAGISATRLMTGLSYNGTSAGTRLCFLPTSTLPQDETWDRINDTLTGIDSLLASIIAA
jgi:hypothetical protein